MKNVLFFGEVGEQDINELGVKAVNLALLFKKKLNVPPGFILSGNIFKDIIKNINVDELLKCPEPDLKEKCDLVKSYIRKYEFPEDIEDDIIEAYLSLSVDLNMSAASLLESREEYVAVRSSYPKSMPAPNSVLNVKGKKSLFDAILRCCSNAFDYENMLYFRKSNIKPVPPALIVQRMIDAEKSGVVYPAGENKIIVKACFGLGKGMSSQSIMPDEYVVDKSTLSVLDVKIREKQFEFKKGIGSSDIIRQRLSDKSFKQVLYDNEIDEIARILKKVIRIFGSDYEIEWSIKGKTIYLLKALPFVYSGKEKVEIEVGGDLEKDSNNYQDEKIEIIDVKNNESPDSPDSPESPDFEEDLKVLEKIELFENSFSQPKQPASNDSLESQVPENHNQKQGFNETSGISDQLDQPVQYAKPAQPVQQPVQPGQSVQYSQSEKTEPLLNNLVNSSETGLQADDADVYNEEALASEEIRPITVYGEEDKADRINSWAAHSQFNKTESLKNNSENSGSKSSSEIMADNIVDKPLNTNFRDNSFNEEKSNELGKTFQEHQNEPNEISQNKDLEKGQESNSGFIFDSFASFASSQDNSPESDLKKEKGVSLDKAAELAKLNSGNVIVYCHLSIKQKLKERLLKHVEHAPESFEKILGELFEYEPVPKEKELRELDKTHKAFIREMKYPKPEEVEAALRLLDEV